jgi:hypothetical protein
MSDKSVYRIKDLSPAWMSEALAVGGEIVDLNFQPIGIGQMVDSARVELVGLLDTAGWLTPSEKMTCSS